MTSTPPGQQPEFFDPRAPMASDFEYQSGSAYTTPDPFTKAEPPQPPPVAPMPDFAHPGGNGSAGYPPYEVGVDPSASSPYPQQGASPNPYLQGQPPMPGYQPSPYGPPGAPYGSHPFFGPTQKQNVPAIVGMILSLIAIVACYFGLVLGLAGAILGGVGLSQIRRDPIGQKGRGMAITAIVIGIITTLFWGILIIVIIVSSPDSPSTYSTLP